MSIDKKEFDGYFQKRGISLEKYTLNTPRYLLPYLPNAKDAFILDIGCGSGSFVGDCVITHKRQNVKGIDISPDTIKYCRSIGLPVDLIESIEDFASREHSKYDFIFMSHVLEHLPKENIISTLKIIRDKLLKENGLIFIVVPNAQSSTHAYWAYEDFTHSTLFTTGSLRYVLQSAGFEDIAFVDLDGFSGLSKQDRSWRKLLLPIYKKFKKFEMYLTGSYYHKPSPISYAWEIKAVGYNRKNEQ